MPPTKCVFTAADPLQADAICQALRQAGVEAQAIAEERPAGGVRIGILVPAAQEAKARQIIRQGSWPRLA
jgi:type III secretory pathway lipoprotein EscJ